MNSMTFISFIFFTVLVAVLSWLKTRNDDLSSQDGYFLAGRSLTGIFIGGSLMLTNLSTEQLVGQNGQGYRYTMAVMAWEVTSAFALILMARVFLPRYLKSGITTIPNFLEERYDATTRRIISILFLIGNVVAYLPTVLYSGALVLNSIFNIQQVVGGSELKAIIIMVWTIGIVGSIYAIFGGLKAVAVSDTFNGIGLLIGGFMITILALCKLGEGSFQLGVNTLVTAHPEKLNAIGGKDSPVPWMTLFTGMLFNNLYYWCTNQTIVQRTLGAKNLAEGQKGTLLAGFLKLLGPLYLVLPGIIAFNLYGGSISNQDIVYPKLVVDILPKPLAGFFAAVLFGAILSSFNSALNSSSTLFTLDIYRPMFKPEATDEDLIKIGKKFGTILSIASMAIAPVIMYTPSGLYNYLQECNGFYNVPILAAILVGFFTKRVPSIAPKIALVFHIMFYSLSKIFLKDINFLHVLGFLFPACVIIMLVIGKFKPREVEYVQQYTEQVDITPWKNARLVSVIIVILMLCVYALFSKIGIAS
ncbi:SSS family solute:Na+ symporter [Clostridium tetanomorphum]|uniref:Solute:sodium symporter family transporter n=2 Tax=Clostridium tetanomorphum TaxID=1553 RepID=A0A923IZ77_CLOTT|nr:transporter [Clostridium tetanomorphum DSM 665]MBC2397091.1 solute:sodium symporter family transporter [Clostridium tetanomorphum]MBP1863002.1 SSS family solute:Na+ symporter [Clostridium tetanomorphum]NRS82831.1 SSS family solute:Na+ symporter [Clostridium tetanomorphum]NRZ99065.1 SSS family solute:Na+ symporter [Clostridium tetanomorphum]